MTALKNWGVPFAPAFGVRWPVVPAAGAPNKSVPYTTPDGKVVGNAGTMFHAAREGGKRWHAGVDLVASPGDAIVAIAPGKVLGQIPGYVRLGAVVVQHAATVAVYAEITLDALAAAGLKPGDAVAAGQTIGRGALNYAGRSMLHFELWAVGHAPKAYTPWYQTSPAPVGLFDPTMALIALASGAAPSGGGGGGGGVGLLIGAAAVGVLAWILKGKR